MTVRMANENDIPRMIDLLVQVGQVHHEARPDLFRAEAQKYDETALKRLLADPLRPIFAADEGGVMIGYCFCILKITENDPVLRDRRDLYIDDLCVDEAYRGKNVARTLYDAAVEYARSVDCDCVTLNVWEGNGRARRFYEKCGMKTQKTGMEFILK